MGSPAFRLVDHRGLRPQCGKHDDHRGLRCRAAPPRNPQFHAEADSPTQVRIRPPLQGGVCAFACEQTGNLHVTPALPASGGPTVVGEASIALRTARASIKVVAGDHYKGPSPRGGGWLSKALTLKSR